MLIYLESSCKIKYKFIRLTFLKNKMNNNLIWWGLWKYWQGCTYCNCWPDWENIYTYWWALLVYLRLTEYISKGHADKWNQRWLQAECNDLHNKKGNQRGFCFKWESKNVEIEIFPPMCMKQKMEIQTSRLNNISLYNLITGVYVFEVLLLHPTFTFIMILNIINHFQSLLWNHTVWY